MSWGLFDCSCRFGDEVWMGPVVGRRQCRDRQDGFDDLRSILITGPARAWNGLRNRVRSDGVLV